MQVTACEQLATSLKEKDGTHGDLLSKLEQAEQNAKLLDEKLSAMSSVKSEVEESRDAAVLHKEELLKALMEQKDQKERALEEERRLSAENMEKLRTERDNEVQQISSTLQSKLVQLEEMEGLSTQHVHVLNERENLKKALEDEATILRQQLEQTNAEVSVLQLDVKDKSSRLESCDAQLSSLQQDKETLQSKLIELEEMCASLQAATCERKEADKRLSETSAILDETKSTLEVVSAENEALKSARQEAEKSLLEMNVSLEALKEQHEALLVGNQSIHAELAEKSQELEAVTHQTSTLNESLSEEKLRSATAEGHVKELKETIDRLQADLDVVEDLKSELMTKTSELDLLEERNAEQLNKVILSETASQVAREDHNKLLTTMKSLEDEKGLLSGKVADLEVASTAMQGIIERLEEEKKSFQTSIAGLLQENQCVKAEKTSLKDSIHAKEEALQINSGHLEDVKSQLQVKLEDLVKLEAQLADQTHQIEAAGKVHQALENDHSQLATTAKSFQEEKDALSRDIAVKEAALKAMEDSIEAMRQEKAALLATLGPQHEHSDRSTEEQVKDVDVSNHVVNGETQVLVDIGTNQNGHSVSENGDGVNVDEFGIKNKYSDDKDDDRRTHEQVKRWRILFEVSLKAYSVFLSFSAVGISQVSFHCLLCKRLKFCTYGILELLQTG